MIIIFAVSLRDMTNGIKTREMKEDLKNKIDHLVQNISRLGTQEGREESDRLMKEAMALAVTPEEKKEAGAYLRQELILRKKRPDVDVSAILGDTRDILSLSCFSQKYFGKDRSWFSQRLNGSMVNGKKACFTQKELTILIQSLQDLSRELSDISTTIHQSL